MNRAQRCSVVVFIALALSACAGNVAKGDWVAEKWRGSMLSYHMFPVYPPSSAISVGQIYAVTNCEDGCKATASQAYLQAATMDYIPLAKDLNEQYKKRTILNPDSKARATTPFIQGVDISPDIAALPGISISNDTQQSGSLGVTAKVANFFAGADSHHNEASNIVIRGVSTYGLSAPAAMERLKAYCDDVRPSRCLARTVEDELYAATGTWQFKRPTILMVTHVTTATSISYTYSNESAFGAESEISADLAALIPLLQALKAGSAVVGVVDKVAGTVDGKIVEPLGKKVPEVVDGVLKPAGPVGAKVAGVANPVIKQVPKVDEKVLGTVNNVLKTLDGLLNLDVKGSAKYKITSVSKAGITLTETFDRPVVIGYTGVSMLSVNPCDYADYMQSPGVKDCWPATTKWHLFSPSAN